MSRPPKSTAEHILHGTFRKDRHGPKARPTPRRGRPKMPTFLGPIARATWRTLVGQLDRIGLLTVVDGEVLACFCVAVEEVQEATKLIAKEGRTCLAGSGGLKAHPAVAMQRSAMAAVRDFGALLGLDPASRGRLTLPPDPSSPEGDPLFDGNALG